MRKLPIVCSLLALAALAAKEAGVFAVLKSDAAVGKQASGVFLVPTNQLLRPWGEQTLFPGRPVDITFDSKKRVLAILNTRSVLLMDGSTGTQVAEIKARSTSYNGVAFRPGDRELWASEATRNGPDSILVAEISDLGLPGKSAHIELEGHPVPAGIAFSRDGATPGETAGMGAAGFTGRESLSVPLRLPNTTALQAGGSLAPQLLDQW